MCFKQSQPEEVELFEARSSSNLPESISNFDTGQSMDGISSIIAYLPGTPDPCTFHEDVISAEAILKIFVDM